MNDYIKLSIRVPAVLLVGFITWASSSSLAQVNKLVAHPWPTVEWAVSSPADQNMTGEVFSELSTRIREGRYGYVDRMIVIKNGHMVVDESFPQDYREISRGTKSALGCGWETCETTEAAEDPYNYYHPSTHPYFQGRAVHSLQSVTKSIAATVIGAAIQKGAIESVDVPLLSFFQEYDLSEIDPRLHSATLEDLLTMRSGIEWHEQDRPLNETNTTLQLERSQDWIQFTLDQPMDAEPGTKWAYNSGGSHLMSGIIKQATGKFIDDYAEEVLFGPLGITEYHWKKTPQEYPDTEGGLYLTAPDLAKIGYLVLNEGMWDGEQIVDPTFTRAATSIHADRVDATGRGYGYQWWRLDRDGVEIWAGMGFGEQYLLVLPEFDMVGVINAWNLFGRTQDSIQRAFIRALIQSVKA